MALTSNQAFRLVITVRVDGGSGAEYTKIRGLLQLIDSSAESLNTTPHHLGRKVGSTLDVNLLRRWFDTCHTFHDHTSPATNQPAAPLSINLIDIDERRIHSTGLADGYIEYAALSYTWGGDQMFKLLRANFERWCEPGGMPEFDSSQRRSNMR